MPIASPGKHHHIMLFLGGSCWTRLGVSVYLIQCFFFFGFLINFFSWASLVEFKLDSSLDSYFQEISLNSLVRPYQCYETDVVRLFLVS